MSLRHGTASLCGGSVRRTIELGQLRQLLLQLDLGSLRNSYSYFMSDNPILCLGLCNIGPVKGPSILDYSVEQVVISTQGAHRCRLGNPTLSP